MSRQPYHRPRTPQPRLDSDYDAYLLQRTIQNAIQPLSDKIDRLQGSTYDKGVLDQRFGQLERDIKEIKDSLGKTNDRQAGANDVLFARIGGIIGAIGGLVVILHYIKF